MDKLLHSIYHVDVITYPSPKISAILSIYVSEILLVLLIYYRIHGEDTRSCDMVPSELR